MSLPNLFASEISTDVGYLHVYANNNAVAKVVFSDSTLQQTNTETEGNAISQKACAQLQEYFLGQRKEFDLPLAPIGTDFQKRVWAQLLQVSYGHTASYLDIAKALYKPTASRAIGAANGKNPISIIVPCHRIIGANGSLTGYAGGLERKSYLLSLEQSY